MDRLPMRIESRVSRVLGLRQGDLEIWPGTPGELPNLRCVLPRPATAKASLVLRVHSRAGIPLASGSIDVHPGDQMFETSLAVLAMEGYAHLGRADRRLIEERVWLRRSFATLSAV
jgi:hypothetical protein